MWLLPRCGPLEQQPAERFLTEEDVEHLENLPPTPTPQECRLLWAGLLEFQDEEAMREDTARALASPDNTMPGRISLAARLLCRIRRLLRGRSANGLLRLSMALPSLLNGVHEAVTDEIERVIQSRQQRTGTKRPREEEGAEAEEEEVQLEEDGEVDPHAEQAALVQTRGHGPRQRRRLGDPSQRPKSSGLHRP